MKKFSLLAAVFICGASTMILEMVASRILAPYAGASIFVWTNLIGVILAFLSLGYLWGGILADQNPDKRVLSRLILMAALWVLVLGFASDPVLVLIQKGFRDERTVAFLASLILLGVPSTLLGMVSPYAAKLTIQSLDENGYGVGKLYALSTAGSILGTFFAGFVLLSYFKNGWILFSLSGFLVLASAMVSGEKNKSRFFFFILSLFFAATSDVWAQAIHGKSLVDVNTPYSRVWIYDVPLQNGKTVKLMQINHEISSMKYLEDPELAALYTRFYRLDAHFCPEIKNALMLGGAGYSYPQDFISRFPEARMDVVEIDPGVTVLAQKYFGLPEKDPRLTIYHEDARTYLNRTQKTYDVVLSDVFYSSSIPFHLTTIETMQKICKVLNEKGVFMANVISSVEGESGGFLRAELATIRKVFPQVYVFAVQKPEDGNYVQNFMVVALKSKQVPKFYSRDSELHEYLQHLWFKPIPEDRPVLTDAFAPVERYSLKIRSESSKLETPLFLHWKRIWEKFASKH